MKVAEGETLSFENDPGDLIVLNDAENLLKEGAVHKALKLIHIHC